MTLGKAPRSVARSTDWWSFHTHSRFSVNDALPKVSDLVARAVELEYPALSLTDHGTMAGAHELYTAGKAAGLPVLPGIEMYVMANARDRKAMHLTMTSYTAQGYRNLVALANQAHRQYYYSPRLELADLAAAAEAGMTAGIAVGTGCRSGPVVRALLERGPEAAQQIILALAGWFPKLYVEVMDHQFAAEGMEDSAITETLFSIAWGQGLPMILSSDSHFVLPEHKRVHDNLKSLIAWTPTPEDAGFHGVGYYLPTWADFEHVPDKILDVCEQGLADLASAAKVTIPELDVFTAKIPDVTFKHEEVARWRELVWKAFDTLELSKTKLALARERLEAELAVFESSGMCGYSLLIHLVCEFMEREDIWFHIRGSAAGSFCYYLTGITQYDPIQWDIRMDRFLSGDRTSLPDVDIDIEHTRRDEVVALLESMGFELRQVGTQPVYGLDFKSDNDEEEKGSLRVKYFAALRRMGSDIAGWAQVPQADKDALSELSSWELISGVGAHPGGFIVASDGPTVACLPMVRIDSSGTMVTAFNKDQVEAMGFPKIDLLGSKVLTAIRLCCELVTNNGSSADTAFMSAKEYYRSIPMDDPATIKRCGSGKTTGLFQLGGWTNRRGLEELKPKKTSDIVAAQALFRPAPLASGFTRSYLDRREKKQPVPVMHADIMAETKETYGVALYQEQVVGLMRRIGMQPAQLTKMLKAVKSSGKAGEAAAKKTVAENLVSIRELASTAGWGEADVEYLAQCLVDYGAGYSFGKGHSVTYGVVGYLTGFLAEHQPLAYWTGMLNAYLGSKNSKGEPLEPMYVRAAREDNVRVIPAHVNHSGLGYTPDPERFAIRKGLVSIKGVGVGAAAELVAKRPFTSLVDLGQRVTSKVTGAKELVEGKPASECKGNIAALAEAKALDKIPLGEPIVKVDYGRKRKCEVCKTTFPTPKELVEHIAVEHPAEETP